MKKKIKEIELMKKNKKGKSNCNPNKNKRKKNKNRSVMKIDNSNFVSFSKMHLNHTISEKGKRKKLTLKNMQMTNRRIEYNSDNDYKDYNDYELNMLSYQNAKKYDKRNFCSYYISLIRAKQPLIFAFCPIKDYNSRIIKIDLFFISISIYYFINALFFNESLIHKIYKDEGIYNLIYQIPYILYSFIISHLLNTFITYIFLSERDLIKIRSENNNQKRNDIISNVKKCLVIKYICFFSIFSTISIFFLVLFVFIWSSISKYTNSFT